jgi:hypothetical protein
LFVAVAFAFAFVFAFLVVIPEGDLLLQLPVFLFVIRSAIEITGYPPSMREDLLSDISWLKYKPRISSRTCAIQ